MSVVYAFGCEQQRLKYIDFNHDDNIAYISLKEEGRPCFTLDVLHELLSVQQNLVNNVKQQTHILLSSNNPYAFSLGGDLNLFKRLIRSKDRNGLYTYMKLCIDVLLVANNVKNIEKVAVIRGMAFGGGFEAALSCNYIIAEDSAMLGFPERFFNLFPGMGAYSFLVNRVAPNLAREIITSSKTYTATELKTMGVIDEVVSAGNGMQAAHDYIKHTRRFGNALTAMRQVVQKYQSVNYNDLLDIGEIWVDTALAISDRDLQIIERLERGQQKYTLTT